MLKGMQKNEELQTKNEVWFLYILECTDGTYYTGITKDLKRRFEEHNSGKGARYTRPRIPVTLVYQESCASRSAALIRECAIKALPKQQKKELIQQTQSL